MEGLQLSGMPEIYSMVWGKRWKVMRDGYDDQLRDTADVTCNDRLRTNCHERTITRLHHL